MTYDEQLRFAWYLGQRGAQLFDAGKTGIPEYIDNWAKFRNLRKLHKPDHSDKSRKLLEVADLAFVTYNNPKMDK
jgi:hypothetical protein